ncbi:MAG TPA: hypothetical protein ENH70_00515 [Desulfobacteraceae bacterium]|nr:MAG: hypothetical protein B1H13_12195 [Desulfobacteraceae bacterium 4484_190.3]RLB16681.1 MAG: hypothetical protein DRG82_08510 [Deltaproteobacteria bacterium]HDZ23004.1 hypothetical protein [Desulfobacteraceae bacterium]
MKDKKECFGIIDRVFPVGESGLREVVPECFDCVDRVECLKTALKTSEGIGYREDLLEERSSGGVMGVIRRWSEKKTLSRLREKEREKR